MSTIRTKMKDRVALVTGASSGIGRVLVTLAAADGYDVVVADIGERNTEGGTS